MGYRGKVAEQQSARVLRAAGMRIADIAAELGVARSSVSLWVRDVELPDGPLRRRAAARGPNALQRRKQDEIARLRAEGAARIGELSQRDLLIAGAALYAGEGGKTNGQVRFANTDPMIVRLFLDWLRTCLGVDEARLRARLYLHQGLDLDAAQHYWSEVTGIRLAQFTAPHRPPADATIRRRRHEHGCICIVYACTATHRAVMGVVDALLASPVAVDPG